jgi:ABC-type glycerol-3-phosphate transport system substrate-binding protein
MMRDFSRRQFLTQAGLGGVAMGLSSPLVLASGRSSLAAGAQALSVPKAPFKSPLQMRIWGAYPDFVQNNVKAYEDQYGQSVAMNVIGGDYPSIVQNLLQQKQPLDMMYSLTHVLAAWRQAGWIVDFDRFWAREEAEREMLPAVRDAATIDGHLMGLPYFAFVHGMMLGNTDVLKKAGVYGEWPKTYTELYSQVRKIKQSGASDHPYLPFWITSFAGIPWGFVQEALNRNIPLFGEGGKPLLDEKSEAVDMLDQWRALYKEKLVPQGILSFQESDFTETFAKGGIAYASHLEFYLPSLQDPNTSSVAGKIVPVPRQGQNWGMLHVGLYLIGAAGQTDERLAADYLLAQHFGYRDQKTKQFTVPLEWAKKYFLTQGYAAVNDDPAVTAAVSKWLPEPEKNLPILKDSLEAAQYPKNLFHAPWALRWLTYAASELQKAVTGDETSKQVVKNLRQKADQLVEQFQP